MTPAALPPADILNASRALPGTAARGTDTIDAAAKEFEAVFVNQMLESMWAGVGTNGTFLGGHGEAVTRSLLNAEYGKAIAASGGIGIADAVRAELLRMQEART